MYRRRGYRRSIQIEMKKKTEQLNESISESDVNATAEVISEREKSAVADVDATKETSDFVAEETASVKEAKKSKRKNVSVVEGDSPDEVRATATADSYTPEQINEILDDLAATPKRKRVWEVDFLRGLMILFVVWDHFMWDVASIGSNAYNSGLFQWLYELSGNYYSGVLRRVTHDVFVTMFVITSGVSSTFSHNNRRRALKMIAFALLLSAGTYALSSVFGMNITINFNVIHVIALSTLLWSVIDWAWKKCDKNWKKNIFGVVMFCVTMTALVVGHCAKAQPIESDNAVWYFLVHHSSKITSYVKFRGGDYLPFLPDFGWFLVGAFLGKALYKWKRTHFPSVNPKWVAPVTFCGRNSLWVYLLSQIVMFSFVYLLHGVLNWL